MQYCKFNILATTCMCVANCKWQLKVGWNYDWWQIPINGSYISWIKTLKVATVYIPVCYTTLRQYLLAYVNNRAMYQMILCFLYATFSMQLYVIVTLQNYKYFAFLYYRLLPLILYKSHLMIRVMWLCWVLPAMMMKWAVRNSLWWFRQQISNNLSSSWGMDKWSI